MYFERPLQQERFLLQLPRLVLHEECQCPRGVPVFGIKHIEHVEGSGQSGTLVNLEFWQEWHC